MNHSDTRSRVIDVIKDHDPEADRPPLIIVVMPTNGTDEARKAAKRITEEGSALGNEYIFLTHEEALGIPELNFGMPGMFSGLCLTQDNAHYKTKIPRSERTPHLKRSGYDKSRRDY
jgi:hypothetical protein